MTTRKTSYAHLITCVLSFLRQMIDCIRAGFSAFIPRHRKITNKDATVADSRAMVNANIDLATLDSSCMASRNL